PDKPLCKRGVRPVEDGVPGFLPGQFRGLFTPPAFRVLNRALVHRLVLLHRFHAGGGGEWGRRSENPVFFLVRFDVVTHGEGKMQKSEPSKPDQKWKCKNWRDHPRSFSSHDEVSRRT